ncbi:MAG: hypothetical protein AB1898_29010 [Acidobacteriota bacterium]
MQHFAQGWQRSCMSGVKAIDVTEIASSQALVIFQIKNWLSTVSLARIIGITFLPKLAFLSVGPASIEIGKETNFKVIQI